MEDAEFTQMQRLFRAAQDNKPATVRKLLRQGVDVQVADEDGWTALHRAALAGAVEVVRLLLDVGARPDPLTREGWPPLYGAIHQGHAQVVGILLDAGTDLETFGGEALFRALRRDRSELFDTLLERGADPNARDEFGCVLGQAIRDDKGAQVEALLAAGADPKGCEERGALVVALARGRPEIVARLLDAGAEPNFVDARGASPLAMAAAMGDCASAERLLVGPGGESMLDRSEGEGGLTPLLEAARAGQVAMLDWLLERGATVHACDRDGRSAHTQARLGGHEQVLARLESLGLAAQTQFDDEAEQAAESRATIEVKEAAKSADFVDGQAGRIRAGAFANFEGRAIPAQDGQLRVLVEIFGRKTEVTISEDEFEAAAPASE